VRLSLACSEAPSGLTEQQAADATEMSERAIVHELAQRVPVFTPFERAGSNYQPGMGPDAPRWFRQMAQLAKAYDRTVLGYGAVTGTAEEAFTLNMVTQFVRMVVFADEDADTAHARYKRTLDAALCRRKARRESGELEQWATKARGERIVSELQTELTRQIGALPANHILRSSSDGWRKRLIRRLPIVVGLGPLARPTSTHLVESLVRSTLQEYLPASAVEGWVSEVMAGRVLPTHDELSQILYASKRTLGALVDVVAFRNYGDLLVILTDWQGRIVGQHLLEAAAPGDLAVWTYDQGVWTKRFQHEAGRAIPEEQLIGHYLALSPNVQEVFLQELSSAAYNEASELTNMLTTAFYQDDSYPDDTQE